MITSSEMLAVIDKYLKSRGFAQESAKPIDSYVQYVYSKNTFCRVRFNLDSSRILDKIEYGYRSNWNWIQDYLSAPLMPWGIRDQNRAVRAMESAVNNAEFEFKRRGWMTIV